MSRLIGAIFCLLVVGRTLALTNLEFLELVKDYATDVEIQDVTDDVSDDVIELPGGPSDEFDLEYLFRRLGFTLTQVYPAMSPYEMGTEPEVVQDGLLGGCSCRALSCNCCGSHHISFKVFWKKISFTLSGCIDIKYLTANKGFYLSITLNGNRVYSREISLANPPALCYGIPGFKGFARVCLQFYNVDIGNRRACAKLSGVLDFKVKKYSVDLGLGCFSIPLADDDASIRTRLIELLQTGHTIKSKNLEFIALIGEPELGDFSDEE